MGSEPNFVIKRTLQPHEAIQLLVERFPFVLSLGDSLSELIEMGPYYAYGVFVSEVLSRSADPSFLQSVARFIDEIADHSDAHLNHLLLMEIFEGITGEPVVAKLKPMLGLKSRQMLEDFERSNP